MQIKTTVRAGGLNFNHSQGCLVRSKVRAGGMRMNHSQGKLARTG